MGISFSQHTNTLGEGKKIKSRKSDSKLEIFPPSHVFRKYFVTVTHNNKYFIKSVCKKPSAGSDGFLHTIFWKDVKDLRLSLCPKWFLLSILTC